MKLAKVAKQVTITICSDAIQQSANPDTDIFYDNKQTVEKILKLVKEHHIAREKDIFLKHPKRFASEELLHLEHNLYQASYTNYLKPIEHIRIFLAENPYAEVEHIAQNITRLVRDRRILLSRYCRYYQTDG